MKKLLFNSVLVLVLSSCTNVHVKYTGKVKNKTGKERSFEYQKSYNTGYLKGYCAVSGILYGGYCWKYLDLPTAQMKLDIIQSTKKELDTEVGKDDYQIHDESISRVSFSKRDTVFKLYPSTVKSLRPSFEESIRKEIKRNSEQKNNIVSLITRSEGQGIRYSRKVFKKTALELTYISEDNVGGFNNHTPWVKDANNYSFGLSQTLTDDFHQTSFNFNFHYLLSKRKTFSLDEDLNDGLNRVKHKKASFIELGPGVKYVFFRSLNLSLRYYKSIEITSGQSHRKNFNNTEFVIGWVF